MGKQFLLVIAVLEFVTSFRPEGGLLSSLFAGWRAAAPGNGALAEITSSHFLTLALSTPILVDANAAARTFRRHVIIPRFFFVVARSHQNRIKGITLLVVFLLAYALVRSVTLFFTDGLQFSVSVYPVLVLFTSFLLRFGLLNLPRNDEFIQPNGEAVEEIGEVNEPAIYPIHEGAVGLHFDYNNHKKGCQRHFGPTLVSKMPGERVIMLQSDTVHMTHIFETLTLGQTKIDIKLDLSTLRAFDDLGLHQGRLRGGVPTREALRPEIKRLVETQLRETIYDNGAYQNLEKHTRDYLVCNTHLPTESLKTAESIRQLMATAGADLGGELIAAESRETFRLHGIFYCRIYVEDIQLSETARAAFDRMRRDAHATVISMREDRQGDINAIASLLKSIENMEEPRVHFERAAIDVLDPHSPALASFLPSKPVLPAPVNQSLNQQDPFGKSLQALSTASTSPQASEETLFGKPV